MKRRTIKNLMFYIDILNYKKHKMIHSICIRINSQKLIKNKTKAKQNFNSEIQLF